jgi:arylsulfatase A-like enzyme
MLMLHYKPPHRWWEPAPDKYHLYDSVTFPLPATFWDDYSCRGSAAAFQKMEIKQYITQADVKLTDPTDLNAAQRTAWLAAYNAVKQDFNGRGWNFTDSMNQQLTIWKYQRFIQDYLRCISSVDDDVGRVLDYLRTNGLENNTVVIYTSDQGFYLGEHGWFDKRFAYEQSLRTPLLVRWPGVVAAGSRNNDIVSNLDYAETILDIAGVSVPADMQGRSFKPLLQGQRPADWRKYFYYHYYEMLVNTHNVYRHYAVTDSRYKLLYFWDIGEYEFYDLQSDPDELVNQYYVPQLASTINGLKQKMDSLRTAFQVPPDTLLSPTPPTISVPHCPMVSVRPAGDVKAKATPGFDLRAARSLICYHVPASVPQVLVKIMLFDMKGTLVRTLVDEPEPPGYHVVSAGGKELPLGIYCCSMTAPGYSKTIMVLKVDK